LSDSNVQTISQLVENDAVFQCQGYSEIKVAYRGQDGDGKPCTMSKTIRIPIKTAGVLAYEQEIAASAPQPPITRRIVRAGSDEAKEFGYSKDTELITYDLTDENYVDAMAEHNKDFVYRVAICAMDIEWKMKAGEADSFEKKKQILQSSGISGPQLDKIYSDVLGLARHREDREDFLSASSSDTMKKQSDQG
jgi:hypothetical protein